MSAGGPGRSSRQRAGVCDPLPGFTAGTNFRGAWPTGQGCVTYCTAVRAEWGAASESPEFPTLGLVPLMCLGRKNSAWGVVYKGC